MIVFIWHYNYAIKGKPLEIILRCLCVVWRGSHTTCLCCDVCQLASMCWTGDTRHPASHLTLAAPLPPPLLTSRCNVVLTEVSSEWGQVQGGLSILGKAVHLMTGRWQQRPTVASVYTDELSNARRWPSANRTLHQSIYDWLHSSPRLLIPGCCNSYLDTSAMCSRSTLLPRVGSVREVLSASHTSFCLAFTPQ